MRWHKPPLWLAVADCGKLCGQLQLNAASRGQLCNQLRPVVANCDHLWQAAASCGLLRLPTCASIGSRRS